jgi:predicted secreted Zn-dependent protease
VTLTTIALTALTIATGDQVAAAQAPAPAAPRLARFADVPNVAVNYYNVTGLDVPQIVASIRTAAPRNPQTGAPIPATSDWTVGVKAQTSTTGTQCKLQSVALRFQATARMPRLVTAQSLSAPMRASWDQYVASLESRQAAQLQAAYSQLPAVEAAIKQSSCADWQKTANAALQRLQDKLALARASDTTPPSVLIAPTAPAKAAKRRR